MAISASVSLRINRFRRWLRVNLFHGKGYRRLRHLVKIDDPFARIILFGLCGFVWMRKRDRQTVRGRRLVRKVAVALRPLYFVQVRVPSERYESETFDRERYVDGVMSAVAAAVPTGERDWRCEFGMTLEPCVPCLRFIVNGRTACFILKRDESLFR